MKRNRLVYGVGTNDADYTVKVQKTVAGKYITVWDCPYYDRWKSMLRRCYSKKSQVKFPTYKGCSVCEEWLYFSNFKKWMELQNWKGRALDKDFLVEGNKVYSPDTCLFIPNKLNSFVVTSSKTRGIYPLGVYYQKKHKNMINEYNKPYVSKSNNQTNKQIFLGSYTTPEAAHQRYLVEKLRQCKEYLNEFKDELLVVNGLTRIKDKIQHHIDNNLELTEL